MSNENCLEGMKCPECGSEGPFMIQISALVEMTDDGTGDLGDTEWDNGSYCECKECDFSGIVANFREAGEIKQATCQRIDACGYKWTPTDEQAEHTNEAGWIFCPECQHYTARMEDDDAVL